MQKQQYDRRGAMAPLLVICLPVLLALIAFAIQLTFHELAQVELRVAIDAAAEAGARKLSETGNTTQATTAAQNAAARNMVGGAPCVLADSNVLFGHVTRPSDTSRYEFAESSYNPTALRIVVSQQRNHVFQVLSDSLSVSGSAVAGQIDCDIALVLDRSGSMVYVHDDGTPTNWVAGDPAPPNSRWVKVANAANLFLDELVDTPMAEKVALVTYNGTAGIDDELTFGYLDVRASIDNYTQNYVDGATNIADGIEFGRQALFASGLSRSWAAKAIVIMTDGKHNTGTITPQDAAALAAGQGIMIHTITYGDDADQTVMQEVADEGGGTHWHAPNSGVLRQVFREIADNLPTMLME